MLYIVCKQLSVLDDQKSCTEKQTDFCYFLVIFLVFNETIICNSSDITKIIFIHTPFWGIHLQVRPVDGFARIMAQTTRTRARMCLLWIFSHGSPFRGQPPKNNLGAWIGVFKPKSWNRKICILSKLLHRFQPNFAKWHRPSNALHGWSQCTKHKSKMSYCAILEK